MKELQLLAMLIIVHWPGTSNVEYVQKKKEKNKEMK